MSVPSTVVASPVTPTCGAQARDVRAAGVVAGRLLREFMAYSLGRLGSRPSFRDATASFQSVIWGMSHSPPPTLAGASATVTLTRAELIAPRVAVARFMVRIDRPRLTAFSMLVVVSLRGCWWRAGGF